MIEVVISDKERRLLDELRREQLRKDPATFVIKVEDGRWVVLKTGPIDKGKRIDTGGLRY